MPTWGLTSPNMTRSGSTPAVAPPAPPPALRPTPQPPVPRPAFPVSPSPTPNASFGRPLGGPARGVTVSGANPSSQQAAAAAYGARPPAPALGSPGLPMPGQQQMPAAPPPPPRGPVTNNKWRMQQQIGGVTPDARKYAPPAANGLPDQAQRAAGSKQGPQMQTVGGYSFIK